METHVKNPSPNIDQDDMGDQQMLAKTQRTWALLEGHNHYGSTVGEA